jgi:hypothetical protein
MLGLDVTIRVTRERSKTHSRRAIRDQQAEQHSFDTLAETYTRGGRFCRNTKSMLTH